MNSEVFLDTAYAIALSSRQDNGHERALQLADAMEAEGTRMVTTSAIMLEIGNALSKRRFRHAAVALLEALDADPKVETVAFSPSLYRRAFDLFRQRPDKEWGLIDCVSFVVMEERQLSQALTSDEHYRQAGFEPLMIAP